MGSKKEFLKGWKEGLEELQGTNVNYVPSVWIKMLHLQKDGSCNYNNYWEMSITFYTRESSIEILFRELSVFNPPTLEDSYSYISTEGNIVLTHGEEEVNLLSCCPVL